MSNEGVLYFAIYPQIFEKVMLKIRECARIREINKHEFYDEGVKFCWI